MSKDACIVKTESGSQRRRRMRGAGVENVVIGNRCGVCLGLVPEANHCERCRERDVVDAGRKMERNKSVKSKEEKRQRQKTLSVSQQDPAECWGRAEVRRVGHVEANPLANQR